VLGEATSALSLQLQHSLCWNHTLANFYNPPHHSWKFAKVWNSPKNCWEKPRLRRRLLVVSFVVAVGVLLTNPVW